MTYTPNSATIKKLKLSAIGSGGTFQCYANHKILGITIKNNTANAITGGIKIGTTNGGTEVVVGVAVGANVIFDFTDTTILKRFFSDSSDTTLYYDTVVSWNSANIDMVILFVELL